MIGRDRESTGLANCRRNVAPSALLRFERDALLVASIPRRPTEVGFNELHPVAPPAHRLPSLLIAAIVYCRPDNTITTARTFPLWFGTSEKSKNDSPPRSEMTSR
jgi:hypothetical protein